LTLRIDNLIPFDKQTISVSLTVPWTLSCVETLFRSFVLVIRQFEAEAVGGSHKSDPLFDAFE
jgi:thiamine monophosphate kinase